MDGALQMDLVETDISHLKQNNPLGIGIDVGVESDITLSSGKKFKGPKALRSHLEKLKLLNRRLHRKIKGSKNRAKAALRVARLHKKISDVRSDFIHKATMYKPENKFKWE